MKEKIILFVIGLLLGAVIATGAFYIYSISSNSCNNSNSNTQSNSQPPEMPSGQNSSNQEPPEKPSNESN